MAGTDLEPQSRVKIRELIKTFRNNGIQVPVLTGIDLDIFQEESWQW